MKRILSFLFVLVLTTAVFTLPACAQDITSVNVCYRRPVTSSSRMQINEIYPLNLTDGNYNLRASSYTMDLENPYEWFRIDLGADYTISEIVVSTTANMSPKSLAIDVWSNGKWVRVVQDYGIETADFPKVYYFDEIDASYIQLSVNELPNVPADAQAVNLYLFSLSEVEAYHTVDISDNEKSASFESVPDGAPVIPVPADVNPLFFKQGKRDNSTVGQQIPENDLTSFMGQFDGFMYYDTDIAYFKSLYAEDRETADWIAAAKTPHYTLEGANIKSAAINDEYYFETSVDWNPILFYSGITLIALGIVGIIITLICTIVKKRKNK